MLIDVVSLPRSDMLVGRSASVAVKLAKLSHIEKA